MSCGKMEPSETAEIKKLITSLLISNPLRCTVQQLSQDYLAIEGQSVPFKKLGFSTLEDYLRSIPDVLRIHGRGPDAEIKVVITSKSEHINKMILKQKKHKRCHIKPSRKLRRDVALGSGRSNNRSTAVTPVKNNSSAIERNFIHNNIRSLRSNSTPLDETKFSSYLENTNSLRCVSYEAQQNHIMDANLHKLNSQGCNASSVGEDHNSVPCKIRNNLRELMKQFPNGMECSKLPIEYKKMFNKRICYEQYNFRSLIEMCSDMPDIFRYVQKNSDDYILYESGRSTSLNCELTKAKEKHCDPTENITGVHMLEEFPNLNWSTTSHMIPSDVLYLSDKVSRFFPVGIEVGDILDISVGEICDLSKFWVYMTYGDLESLMRKLQIFYSDHSRRYLIPEVLIEEGLYCVSMYSGSYHRCTVVNLLPKYKGLVRVFYVDYGTVENVCSSQLWFLSKQFANAPCQAIRTRLSNICPVYENRPWSSEAVIKFEQLCNRRIIVAEVTKIDPEDQVMEVYLADITDKRNIFYINEVMVNEGFALYVDQERKKSPLDQDCCPHVDYIHLYPEFDEIESGNAPTTEEMKYIVGNKMPLQYYMSRYFDIQYSEDTDAIEIQHEVFIKEKIPDYATHLDSDPDEFDFSYFPDCVLSEMEALYDEEQRSKKATPKFTRRSEISRCNEDAFKNYFCNKKRITELIHGKSSEDIQPPHLRESQDVAFLTNNFSKLNISSDFLIDENIFLPHSCRNPFLNGGPSNTSFVSDARKTLSNNELLEIFSKPLNQKLSQKIVNLNETSSCKCKTSKNIL